MKRRWLLAVLLAAVLGIGAYAATRFVQADQPQADPRCPCFAMLQQYLGLTAAQRDATAGIDERYGRERPVLRQELWDARDNLLSVLQDSNSTQQQAVAAAKQFGAAQQALQLNTISYAFELRKHLTPQQRAKMHGLLGRGMCAATCGAGLGGPGADGSKGGGACSVCPGGFGPRGGGRGPRGR